MSSIGKEIPLDGVSFGRSGTKYQDIVDRVKKLKANKGLVLDTPDKVKPAVYMARIAAAVKRLVQPPAGCEIRFSLKDDQVVIGVLKIKATKYEGEDK